MLLMDFNKWRSEGTQLMEERFQLVCQVSILVSTAKLSTTGLLWMSWKWITNHGSFRSSKQIWRYIWIYDQLKTSPYRLRTVVFGRTWFYLDKKTTLWFEFSQQEKNYMNRASHRLAAVKVMFVFSSHSRIVSEDFPGTEQQQILTKHNLLLKREREKIHPRKLTFNRGVEGPLMKTQRALTGHYTALGLLLETRVILDSALML